VTDPTVPHHAVPDLLSALRTTGATREFTDEPVDDATVHRILDNARFDPSGGNRQGWRVVVLRDAAVRRRLRELYLPGWYEYLAMRAAGLTPWAPITDRDAEAAAVASARPIETGFADHLDEAPVLLALAVDLRDLAAVDRDLGRYTFAGGASIYPFAWNLLLAARAEGLGGVITTMAVNREPAVRELLHLPEEAALAAVLALGHPVKQLRRLTRDPVESFTTVDRFDGEPFTG
jgi:nitroreductase